MENTDQTELREIKSLRHHLRSHEHISLSPFKIGDYPFVTRRRCGRIPVETQDAGRRKERRDLLLHLLRTESHQSGCRRPAPGTCGGQCGGVTAQMTLHPVAQLMIGERHAAARAMRHPAALRTLHPRSKSAPVLEKHDLSAAAESRSHPVEQRLIEMEPTFAPLEGPQRIGHCDTRQASVSVTFRKRHKTVFSSCRIHVALYGGGGTCQQTLRPRPPGHPHGTISGIVTRCRFGLFIALVVLLVHDNQPERRQRQEKSRTDSQHELPSPGGQQPPVNLRTAAFAEPGVVQRHPAAEYGTDTGHELGGHGDFGHHIENALPPRECIGHQVHVKFRLPAARNAVQQNAIL